MRERDLISAILHGAVPLPEGVRVGPGDDAAVLEAGAGGWVLSTDLSIEGSHFRFDWVTPEEAGGRAVSAALSDLAAMGARPRGVLLSLAGPDPAVLTRVGRGARARADELGAPVLGGDVARASAVVIDVVVVGEAERPWRRDGARPGDGIWVSGRLGGSGAALAVLLAGATPEEATRARFAAPSPRLELVEPLAALGVRAALDLSDGLLIDAHRLAEASGVALALESERIPCWPGVPATAALRSGEEYELLVALPPGVEPRGLDLTRIGEVVEGTGVRVDGVVSEPEGWDHFGGPSPAAGKPARERAAPAARTPAASTAPSTEPAETPPVPPPAPDPVPPASPPERPEDDPS